MLSGNQVQQVQQHLQQVGSAAQKAVKQANGAAQMVRKLNTLLTAADEKLDKLILLLAGKEPTYDQLIAAKAAKVVPFIYNIEIALAAGSTAVTIGQVTIDVDGFFLLDRVYASFRVTEAGAANLGRWRPISAGNAEIAGNELVAAGPVVDQINFSYEIREGSGQRQRQANATPGDLLYRGDRDGLPYVLPDAFPPASTITVLITPHVAPAHAGTLVFSLWGRHALNVIEDA